MPTTEEQINSFIASADGNLTMWQNKKNEIDAATQANTDGANQAITNLNNARTAFDVDAAAIATTKTQADNDAASIATTKTQTDNAAADIAAAIADINNAIVPKLPFVNLHKDGGRFVDGSDGYDGVSVSSPFSTSLTEIVPYNGAVITEAAKFHYENSTNGGAGEALEQTVQDLLDAQGRAANAKRWGPEFYIAEITAGPSTLAASVSSHYLMLAVTSQLLGLADFISYAAWVRLTAGTAWVKKSNDLRIDGVLQGGSYELQAADGWVHVAGTHSEPYGYGSRYFPSLYGVDGTVLELAMPIVVPADVTIEPHTHPLLSF